MTDPTPDAATIEQAARELLKRHCGLAARQRLDDPRLDGIAEVRTSSALAAISTALRSRSDLPREPTEAMLRAGAAMCDEANDAADRARARGVWWMMYDAALKATPITTAGDMG